MFYKSADLSDRWISDIQFVLDEVERFRGKTPRDYEDKFDIFASLPHPFDKGGQLTCGREARRRLWGVVGDYFLRHDMNGRLDILTVFNNFCYQVSCQFIKNKKHINKSTVQAALAASVNRSRSECVKITHFIPCHISDDDIPRFFSIGAVNFYIRKDFMERQAPVFEKYVDFFASARQNIPADEAKDEGRTFVADATKYFSHFGWVAEVTIESCAPRISRNVARQSLQAALDVLRLMLGEAYAEQLAMEGPPSGVVKTAEMIMVDGKLDISLGRRWPGRELGADWWPKIVERFTEERLAGVGRITEMLVKLERDKPLCQRLLDAITWFGQAVTEQQPAAKIVKFVNGIERITLCNNKYNVTETVCERVAALIVDCHCGDREHWHNRMKDLYKVRSCLVHGSMSPFDPSATTAAREAEELTTRILCRAIDFFTHLGLNTTTWSPKPLDKQFQRLTAWAARAPTAPSS